mmetsp:Transcript_16797/g.47978  ORF Transcript_16797/g.47978 Transcript_16797/m.47978 type:complete len:638 (+) Transcript_16797:51-1964(+)
MSFVGGSHIAPLALDELATPLESFAGAATGNSGQRSVRELGADGQIHEALASFITTELVKQIPRLVFAAVDPFPLAGGSLVSDGLVVLAVRAVPVSDRLDAATEAQLACVTDAEAGPLQKQARLLELRVPRRSGQGKDVLRVSVCWHDIVDFVSLLLRGNPSCVEVVASMEPPLYSSREWLALRTLFGSASCEALLAGSTYRNACAGAAMKLTAQKGAGKNSKMAKQRERKGEENAEHTTVQGGGHEECLSRSEQRAVAALCKRAAAPLGAGEELHRRMEHLVMGGESRKGCWFDLAFNLMAAAKGVPHAASELPIEAVEAWADEIRREDFSAFARESALRLSGSEDPLESGMSLQGLPDDWSARLAPVWPEGAELAFLAQTGSFLYDVQMPSSDCDFSIVFIARVEGTLGRIPPPAQFEHHVHAAFASDKSGEIEYSGRELSFFLVELAKGNARNVELLFTDKPHLSSPVWLELRARRRSFLTLRCARQYMGFISERLQRAAAEVAVDSARSAFDEAAGKRVSKCLYHAYHKLFELRRILAGGDPAVALHGEEREFVLDLRARPPESLQAAQSSIASAEAEREKLLRLLDDAHASARLPREVDAASLVSWLRSVRRRQAAATAGAGAAQAEAVEST